jgi:hypothetical protein
MFKSITLAVTALAIGTTAIAPAAADAQRYGSRYSQGYDTYQGGYRQDGYRQRGYDQRGYARTYRDDRSYARRNTRCNSGTTGTIVGAIAGGLLGRTIDSRGDRALGTVLGGAAGALAGNAVGKSNNPGYCR